MPKAQRIWTICLSHQFENQAPLFSSYGFYPLINHIDASLVQVIGRMADLFPFILWDNNNFHFSSNSKAVSPIPPIGGRSFSGINEEIMWATIIMGIIIAILILIALCYLAREKYQKRREYYVSA